MAQFILSDEEIEILIDALTTEVKEWESDREISIAKGRGDFEVQPIKDLEALRERFLPYIARSEAGNHR